MQFLYIILSIIIVRISKSSAMSNETYCSDNNDDIHDYQNFECGKSSDDDPRMKTRVLNYLRHHYLQIILYLLLASIFFTLIFVLLVVFLILTPRQQNVTTSEVGDLFGDDADVYMPLLPHVAGPNTWGKTIPCARIRCTNSSCTPQNLDYATLRAYTCCNCYDSRYTLRRFQWDYLRKTLSLYFQVPEVISEKSQADIQSMKKLNGLDGSWNMVKEGGTAWYYKYENVSIPSPPPED